MPDFILYNLSIYLRPTLKICWFVIPLPKGSEFGEVGRENILFFSLNITLPKEMSVCYSPFDFYKSSDN